MTAECNEKALLDSLSLSCLPPLASEWHFHLSSALIGSSAQIPIGGSASPHTRGAFTFLTHIARLPLCVYCLSV